jgi:hypothetical protein
MPYSTILIQNSTFFGTGVPFSNQTKLQIVAQTSDIYEGKLILKFKKVDKHNFMDYKVDLNNIALSQQYS